MAQAPDNPLEPAGLAAGTTIEGRYRVLRPLGRGGAGAVYEVEHARTGRHFALKTVHPGTSIARLEQEAKATARLTSPEVVRVTDMGNAPPVGPYLVMELVAGQSLRTLLDEAGQLPLELVANVALQVCECLDEAHRLGLVHRDLKPENLLLGETPFPEQFRVSVLDFGIVKLQEGSIAGSELTRTGSTVGTPYYMSLEQLRNPSKVDGRADLYALGVVLYECLAGVKPFVAETIGDLVFVLCSGPPTDLARLRPDLPSDVSELVMRALRTNRDERPASAREVALALLPHANPYFGLWIEDAGRRPAVAAWVAGARDKAPRGLAAPPGRPALTPAVTPALTPAVRPVVAAPFAIAEPPTDDVLTVRREVAHGAPSPSIVELEDVPSRDTPTRMFVSSASHPRPPLPPEAAEPGERTPTEALAPPSEAEIEAALSRSSPGMRPAAGAPAHPFLPPPALTASSPGPALSPPAPAGPRWRVAVVEAIAPFKRSFDESPRNTQLIVLGAMGVIALSLVVAVVLLIVT
jgi:hypothetical protein